MTDGLREVHRKAIIASLAADDRVERAVLFGSRATGTNTASSDVDIVLFGDRLTLTDQARLAATLEGLPMAQQVDLLLYNTIDSPVLLEDIERHGVEWYRSPRWTTATASPTTILNQQTLKDVADILMGQSPPGETCNRNGVGLPLLNGPTDFGPSHPSPTQSTTDAKRTSRVGDLLFCVRGSTTGRMNWAEQDYAIGRGIAAIRHRTNAKLQPLVRAAIECHLPTLLQSATGSTFPNLSAHHLNSVPFPVFSKGDAEHIAFTLGTLDDKVESNRRTNVTLETMARAIFKDWFVDFGPTRAKIEGQEPYLAPEIWDMFPGRLDDENKPARWHTYALGDLTTHHRATVSPATEPESTFEHYSIPAYDAENEPTLDSGESIRSNKTILPEGAVLLSKLNPEVERVWLPNPKGQLLQISSTEFLAFTPLAPATRSVLFCMFKSEGFRAEMAAMVTGTSKSHQRVSPRALLSRYVLVADARLLGAFENMVRPLLTRLVANRHEARILSQTRDLLLPRLMSGEIRLTDAERTVEAVT